MTSRFLLRFETGDRRGEEIPLGPGKTRMGRRSINEIRVVDPSVSSEHAEIHITPEGVIELSDCGSTNGVRVQGVRIERCQLDPGAVFALGNVKLRLVETEAGAAPALEAPSLGAGGDAGGLVLEEFDDFETTPMAVDTSAQAVPAQAAPAPRAAPALEDDFSPAAALGAESVGEGVGRVSADAVDRASRRSAVGWILGLVILGGAGYVGYTQFAGGAEEGLTAVAVAAVPGNLLEAGYSFEGGDEGAGWEPEPDATGVFALEPGVALSGRFALETVLAGGEWAAARSAGVRVRPERALTLTAELNVEEDAGARVGVRLSSSTGRALPLTAWSPSIAATGGYAEVILEVDVPAAYDRAEALVGAGVTGDEERLGIVQVDDVALVQGTAPRGTAARFEEYELGVYGDAAALIHIDRLLLSRVRIAAVDGGRAAYFAGGTRAAEIRVAPAENGARLTPGAGTLSLLVEKELAGGGVATTGATGYRAHTLEFEEEADAILLGSGGDLVRLGFGAPRRTTGRPVESGYELRITLEPGDEIEVQLTFLEARDEARHLAGLARRAEESGEPGSALIQWAALLDEYPFEAALVSEAEASVGRLFQQGADAVRGVRQELERARFFGLNDLYRQTRDRALELEARYAGTEVAALAEALAEEVDLEIAADELGRAARERARLEAIAEVLTEEGAVQLAEHVRQSVEGER